MADPAAALVPSALAEGQELLDGRLVIRSLLGSGSIGIVYRAEDRRLGRDVALKILSDADGDRLYQLKREFRTLARLSHPNLVQLYELVASGDLWFLVMELVDGVEMTRWLRGCPDRVRVLRVFGELLEGLCVLHGAGHMHRDVKPSNVMVSSTDQAVLLDFGLAAAIRSSSMTMAAGTLDYIAPEQLWNESPGPKADWYSFGVMLYEALTGQLPFASADVLKTKRRGLRSGPRALVADIPPALDDLVLRLLAPDPGRRPEPAEIADLLGVTSQRAQPPPATPDIPFIGRQDARLQLHRYLEDVARGHPRVVHVHGPSGIGKTSLAQQFISEVRGAGCAMVLEGGCHPQESVPYKALDALIDNLARHLFSLGERTVLALTPRHAGALLEVFPVFGRVPGVRHWPIAQTQLTPAEIRRRAFDALRELMGKLADRQPFVLWIDDIQWSDRDSGPVLQALLAPPDTPRILLLLTSRDDEGSADLIAALDESVPRSDIALGPLTADESRELARDLSRGMRRVIDPDALASESGGSPFLLGELVRHFRMANERHDPAEPFSIADLVKSRLDHLVPEARRLVEFVAVAGRPLDADLAVAVAGAGQGGHLLAYALCNDSLLRIGTQDGRRYLEAYHDRIREIAIAELPPEQMRARHRDLAAVIRASRNPDPRVLVTHYLGADAPAEAVRFALLAAEHAERALALDEAVAMYDVVCALQPGARDDRQLLVRRARALANAARRVEAALAYEQAAAAPGAGAADDEERTALRGQAAEQFFYGGDLRRGMAVLRGVLRDVGVRVPSGVLARALVGQWLRLRFLVRGHRFSTADPSLVDARTRARLDTLWRATRGIVMLDHGLADVLAGKHLLDALRLGDTSRALRALGLEAAFEANVGGRFFRPRSRRLLEDAQRWASERGTSYDQAWLAHCRASCAWFDGRWDECLALGRDAEARLRTEGVNAAWELAVLQGFMLSALANLGRFRELSTMLAALITDAERRQDQYALRVFRTGDAVMSWLVDDDPATALRVADETLGDYPTYQFTSQHRHHLVATVQSHLYAGDAELAWTRIENAWGPLRWSGFLLLDCLGTQLRYLRACSALALARAERTAAPLRATLLQAAAHEMTWIRTSSLPMAAPMASAIRAALAGARRQRAEQVMALRTASDGFERAHMALHRATIHWQLAMHAEDGDRLRRESTDWMRSQGIRNPEAMARAVVPSW